MITHLREIVKDQAMYWNYSDATTIQNVRAIFTVGELLLSQVRLRTGYNVVENSGVRKLENLKFQSGDILLARTPGAINTLMARSGSIKGKYSSSFIIFKNETDVYFISAIRNKGVIILNLNDILETQITSWKLLRHKYETDQLFVHDQIHENISEFYNSVLKSKPRYDFEWDTKSPNRFYSAEVPLWSYKKAQIDPIEFKNDFEKEGIFTLLHKLGVRNSNAPLPSDFEYSSQFQVVSSSLIKYDFDIENIIFDKLTSNSTFGYDLSYPVLILPYYRIKKFFTLISSFFIEENKINLGKRTPTDLFEMAFEEQFVLQYNHVDTKMKEYYSTVKMHPNIWEIYDWIR